VQVLLMKRAALMEQWAQFCSEQPPRLPALDEIVERKVAEIANSEPSKGRRPLLSAAGCWSSLAAACTVCRYAPPLHFVIGCGLVRSSAK